MTAARKPVDLAELVADFTAEYLASKGNGAYIVELAPNVFERFLVEALRADPRFVETAKDKWELVANVKHREEALARG